MAKKKEKTEQKKWTIHPQIDQMEPSASISQESVKEFRNGLAKFMNIEKNPPLLGTLAYRAVIDLDHLLRVMQSTPGTIIATYQFTVKPTDKKSAAKMAKEMSKGKWRKVTK